MITYKQLTLPQNSRIEPSRNDRSTIQNSRQPRRLLNIGAAQFRSSEAKQTEDQKRANLWQILFGIENT